MGRILSRVSGHSEIIRTLLQTRLSDRVPSTLLFTGPEGVGRRMVALGWAQALLCPVDPDGCGECGSCLRVEKNESEGLRIVEPEKNLIKIEQSREILGFLNLQALTPYRVILIDGAESLNPQAGNALLKVLEEPPPKTVFILIAPTPRHVLATLRSRALKVAFHALSDEELRRAQPAPDWAIHAAQGRVTKLKKLVSNESQEERSLVLETLKWWLEDAQSYLRPAFRERVKDKDFALELARSFQGFFRDLEGRRWNLGMPSQFPEAGELLRQFPAEAAPGLFEMSLGLEKELKAHRDVQLLFEEFWIRSHQLAKTGRMNA
ncbi:MAG: DNA polymerase III subunit delta' [Bdellovibrionaceae bacterium]|nr:DNA polymerase III subunit delta' [Pseudobdellovibrionaceae bacterium]